MSENRNDNRDLREDRMSKQATQGKSRKETDPNNPTADKQNEGHKMPGKNNDQQQGQQKSPASQQKAK